MFESESDVAEALFFAIGIEVDDCLEIGVESESCFKIELAVAESFLAAVASVVEEGGFKGEASGIDGERRFGGVGSVRGEVAEHVVGGGAEEVVLSLVGRLVVGVDEVGGSVRVVEDGVDGIPLSGAAGEDGGGGDGEDEDEERFHWDELRELG